MRITRPQLKRIINEEYRQFVSESSSPSRLRAGRSITEGISRYLLEAEGEEGDLVASFQNLVNNHEFLKTKGITVKQEDLIEGKIKGAQLQGLSFVVSGVFTQFGRDEIKETIEAHGGKVVGSISSKVNYVLAGDKMGPEKKKKAESLNIPLLTEDDFVKMIS